MPVVRLVFGEIRMTRPPSSGHPRLLTPSSSAHHPLIFPSYHLLPFATNLCTHLDPFFRRHGYTSLTGTTIPTCDPSWTLAVNPPSSPRPVPELFVLPCTQQTPSSPPLELHHRGTTTFFLHQGHNLLTTKWILGPISRVAEVTTSSGTFRCPLINLCPLPSQ